MRVLVDTNIMLDALLEREPFFGDARALMEAIDSEQIVGYVTATTITNIFYIVRSQTRSIERASLAVSEILAAMEICPVDRDILETAFAFNMRDFEDAVQLCCAIAENLEAIITRNPQDFAGAALPILSARQLLESMP
jgi:putative PIN family toxin of toxin-antitoxin system